MFDVLYLLFSIFHLILFYNYLKLYKYEIVEVLLLEWVK